MHPATATMTPHATRCPLHVGRRSFLTALGASAMALKMGLFDFASELFAAEPEPTPAAKPVVHAFFLRPDKDSYWMGWPGACYSVKGSQALYTKVMSESAKKLGIQLQVHDKPLHNTATVNAAWSISSDSSTMKREFT